MRLIPQSAVIHPAFDSSLYLFSVESKEVRARRESVQILTGERLWTETPSLATDFTVGNRVTVPLCTHNSRRVLLTPGGLWDYIHQTLLRQSSECRLR